MLMDMLFQHLVTLFLILLFSMKLRDQKSTQDAELKFFWLTVFSCLLLVLEDVLETLSQINPSLRFWRTLLSVLGYTLRSSAALGLLLVVVPRGKRLFGLYIPCLLTLLVSSTAFFTDIAFGYNENYDFYRGPLGYVAFIVPIFYLVLILWITLKRFAESKGWQKYIIPGCAVFCLAASFADALHGGIRLNEAIMISSIFFYIILRAHDNRRDALTGLLNRQAFYDDCAGFGGSIEAAASIDMNGLKTVNDSLGHHAGDQALVGIAECMQAAANRNIQAYRIGGDEFVILFFHANEEIVSRTADQIRESVSKAGYSISVGYAMRDRTADLEETIRESDQRMYADKANYYRTSGHDRRGGRGGAEGASRV
ncbi:MAG: GGDEF domain-containing protein [Clostridia bacterium]|nr:GGDEF domain-containing protein [Clostridia bacterium]